MTRGLVTALAAAVCASCAGHGDSGSMGLCSLQRTVTQGSHRSVVVLATYMKPLEGPVLMDPDCPDPTEVEFAEDFSKGSDAGRQEFQSLVRQYGEARIVVEGEFYGPGTTAPDAPHQTPWRARGGHPCCPTKIIVHRIRKAERVPGEGHD